MQVEPKDRLPQVLLVDDEPGIRLALQRVLISAGFDVVLASSGAQALELIHTGRCIDAILTDLEMPGMHGSELIRNVRTFDPQVPIVVLTGHRIPGWLPEGAQLCLDKPVDVDVLVETLRGATLAHSGYVRVGARGLASG